MTDVVIIDLAFFPTHDQDLTAKKGTGLNIHTTDDHATHSQVMPKCFLIIALMPRG